LFIITASEALKRNKGSAYSDDSFELLTTVNTALSVAGMAFLIKTLIAGKQ
jgi:hypothetical protein